MPDPTNWTQAEYPVPPWDTPGLPPRRMAERCAHHNGQCAYRDDDPNRCELIVRLPSSLSERLTTHAPGGCGGDAGWPAWGAGR